MENAEHQKIFERIGEMHGKLDMLIDEVQKNTKDTGRVKTTAARVDERTKILVTSVGGLKEKVESNRKLIYAILVILAGSGIGIGTLVGIIPM